jgi:nicotinamidase-related amidase
MDGYQRFLSERDRLVFAKAGYGGRVGFGARPVVLVVDVSYAFCGEKPLPILEAVAEWPNSCGEDAWRAIEVIRRLLQAARDRRLPIIYTTGFSRPIAGEFGLGRWTDKFPPEAAVDPVKSNEIVAPIAPWPHDIVIEKTMPSAFFATNLTSYLINLGADTIIVCGVATSGCVRASVVDGFSRNYRMIVVEDGTFDRGEASHWINLFDMNMKYADVLKLDDVLARVEMIEPGIFDTQMPVLAAVSAGRTMVDS